MAPECIMRVRFVTYLPQGPSLLILQELPFICNVGSSKLNMDTGLVVRLLTMSM